MTIKERWQKFKGWLTIDHIIDLLVDLVLMLWDVLTSPVLIFMRIFRNFFGEWIKEHVKNVLKWFAHFYFERCNKLMRWILAIVFLVVFPVCLIIGLGVMEGFNEVMQETFPGSVD
jgi:uncharacterized sodium:solute symporter family permease YidK